MSTKTKLLSFSVILSVKRGKLKVCYMGNVKQILLCQIIFQGIYVRVHSQILFKPRLNAIILSQVLIFAMFILLQIYFLVGNYFLSEISCGYVNSTTFGNHEAGRIGRFFGLFNIVSFRDDECNSTSTGVRGINIMQI